MADPRYPIRCAAAPAGTGMEGSVGLPCAAVRRLSAGRAWRRRHPETDFAQLSIGPPKGDSHPASAQRLQRDGAGGVNGSISLSSSPRAARQRPIWSHGTAPLTPRHRAPRPASRRIRPRTGWEKQLLLHRAGQRASDRLSTSYWGHRSAGPASSPLSPALAGVRLHAPTPYLQRFSLSPVCGGVWNRSRSKMAVAQPLTLQNTAGGILNKI